MSSHTRQSVVFLLSLSIVALELIWTRLFSAEFYYPFAFLTLSLAIMGLGLGALAVRLAGPTGDERRLGLVLSAAGGAALAGPPLVFRLGLDFEALAGSPVMIAKFAAAVALLAGAFVFGGMALAMVFRANSRDMPRLYMADLVGAGAGVFAAILLMNGIGTQMAVFLCSAPILLAAMLAAPRWQKGAPLVLGLAMIALAVRVAPSLEMPRNERGPVIYRHWDAMSKIKVYGFGDYRSFNIDNMANTGTRMFDGNWEKLRGEPFDFGIDVSNLVKRFDRCRFLSLGAGGGADVLQALQAGAAEVHAVEVNPQINAMLVKDDLHGYVVPSPERAWLVEERRKNPDDPELAAVALPDPGRIVGMDEFSGRLYGDPRVRVVTEDARAYVRRLKGGVDIIYSLSSNTFAALASGSFAMAENYLFTTEAFRDYWRALSGDGFLVMEHQFYMPRIVASALDALRDEGIAAPASHLAVYELPKMRRNVMLLSKQPLSAAIRNSALGDLSQLPPDEIRLIYPPAPGTEAQLVPRIVGQGWRKVAQDAPVNVSPTTDERPFVGQMGLWRNFGKSDPQEPPGIRKLRSMEVFGYPMSKVVIVTILAVLAILVLPLNLLPAVRGGAGLGAAGWLYFFTIGLAFMSVEVVLIQKYTLLVGPSAWSVATVLSTLLVASGLGSFASTRFGDRLPFLAIAGWLVLDALVFRRFFGAFGTLGAAPRMIATALLIAPAGFFMGMPFPKAALRVGPFIDWGFAVNGAASVLGAAGILLVAFQWGFSAALAVGAALYLMAGLLLDRIAVKSAGGASAVAGEQT